MTTPPKQDETALVEADQTTPAITIWDIDPEQFKAALERRQSNRTSLMEWLWKALKEGVDYGRIHVVKKEVCRGASCGCTYEINPGHWSKFTLFKSGAEKLYGMLNLKPTWPGLAEYESKALNGEQIEQIILRCDLLADDGTIIGYGIGARSVDKDYGDLNKALKMCKKSGLIDAVLTTGGLSEIFTQNLEDMQQEANDRGTGANGQEEDLTLDRDAPTGFGKKHVETPWREVPGGYLRYMVRDCRSEKYANLAQAEIDARPAESASETDTSPELRLFTDRIKPELLATILQARYGSPEFNLDNDQKIDLLGWFQAESQVRQLFMDSGEFGPQLIEAHWPGKAYRTLAPGAMDLLKPLLVAHGKINAARESIQGTATLIAGFQKTAGIQLIEADLEQLEELQRAINGRSSE